jgi:hypothetical protein
MAKTSPQKLSTGERAFLKSIGLKIQKELFNQDKPVEWLAFRVGVARSSIREIIAGRSNPRIITLRKIAEGLGYKNLIEFLQSL